MEDEEAKRMVLNCYSAGYEEAMEEWQTTFGRKTVIYPLLMEEMLRRERIDYTANRRQGY